MRKLMILLGTPAVILAVPAVIVQGVIALRTNYHTNCKADAWMSEDFRLWAAELRAAHTT